MEGLGSDFMGQFLRALKLIPPAPWLGVVGSFTLAGGLTTAPASLFALLLFFIIYLIHDQLSPELASEEFERRQFFFNSRDTHIS
jgi:hypothetical protein